MKFTEYITHPGTDGWYMYPGRSDSYDKNDHLWLCVEKNEVIAFNNKPSTSFVDLFNTFDRNINKKENWRPNAEGLAIGNLLLAFETSKGFKATSEGMFAIDVKFPIVLPARTYSPPREDIEIYE